jgi:hypothetical protein
MAGRLRGTPRPVPAGAATLSGNAVLGQVLTIGVPYYTGDPPVTLTYAWIRDASTVIAGQTGATYTIIAADQTHKVRGRVTITNAYDSVTLDTPQSATVA